MMRSSNRVRCQSCADKHRACIGAPGRPCDSCMNTGIVCVERVIRDRKKPTKNSPKRPARPPMTTFFPLSLHHGHPYPPSSSATGTPKTAQPQNTGLPSPMEKEPLHSPYFANFSTTPAAPSRNGNSSGTSSSTPRNPSLVIRLPIAVSPPGSVQKPAELQPESVSDGAIENGLLPFGFGYVPPSPPIVTPVASPTLPPQRNPQPQSQSITCKCCNDVRPTTKPKSDQDRLLQSFITQYWGDVTMLQRVSSNIEAPCTPWFTFDTVIRIIHWEDKSIVDAHDMFTYGITNGLDVIEILPEKYLDVVTRLDSMAKREECLIRVGDGVTLSCGSHPNKEYVVYEVEWQRERSREEVRMELEALARDCYNEIHWNAKQLLAEINS